MRSVLRSITLAPLLLLLPQLHAQVLITEFCADNSTLLTDNDGDYSDWIEIANLSTQSVNLAGWFLTDDTTNLRKWNFPATNLNAGSYLLVFASEKNRAETGLPLHTNFKLSATGEYLALVEPNGTTIASHYTPPVNQQFPDVSYGLHAEQSLLPLITTNSNTRFLVPRSNNDLPQNWTQPNLNDSLWNQGPNALGYETHLHDPEENSYPNRILASQPAIYWRLNETQELQAANLGTLANEATGSFQGEPQLSLPGPSPPLFPNFSPNNLSPPFDGLDDFIQGPPNPFLGHSTFTIAGWINPTTTPNSRTGLWGQNDVVEFGFIDSSTLQLWLPSGSVSCSYPFPLNQWHHVTTCCDGQQLQIYLDGTLVASSTATPNNLGSSTTPFNAGGGGIFDASGNHFAGQLDEISLWQSALPPQQIINLLLDNQTTPVDFSPYIQTDLYPHMFDRNASVCLRTPFTLTNPADIYHLSLRVRTDDGFVAWINDRPVASLHAPTPTLWNSTATTRNPDTIATNFLNFDASTAIDALHPGTNILAIQGLNVSATNTDFLLQSTLTATTRGTQSSTPRYFLTPTPGAPNGTGTQDLGPILTSASHSPSTPTESQPLTITARVQPAFSNLKSVTLHYRVLFGTEITIPMYDTGSPPDATPNDNLFTAQIPAHTAPPGQLIRYYITASDDLGHTSRWPLYPTPTDSEAYQGTVVHDPSITSQLPVIHTFIENPSAADSWSGTQCSIFYLNELYDNLHISLHGQSSSGFPKKSYNLDFNSDHRFRYLPDSPRVKDLKLITNYGDKARVRNTLAHELIAAAGSDSHFCFQARIERNGQFFSITDVMEDADNLWLKRLGRNPDGALYKMYNNLGSASGNEKKTRKEEDFADLQSLISNLDESRPLTTRTTYAWDNLDLPQCVSYCVALALISSQDHGHKNYFLYRDSNQSGEWAPLPWDVDLTWGRNWLDAQGYFTDTLYQDNVLNFYNPAQQAKPANRLYNLIFDQPQFRSMVLRRLRTVMDEILQPPDTPNQLFPIENRIREMMDLMDPPNSATSDADLDYSQWPTWGNGNGMRDEASRIITTHLPGRRNFLFKQNPTLNGDPIPPSQPAQPSVQFGTLDITPASGNQAEEFIELINPNPYALDISGWHLTDAVRHTFRPGTVIPAQQSLFVSPNVQAFRSRQISPSSNENRFVQGNYSGQLNAHGETITLLNASNEIITSTSFTGNPSPAQQYLRISEIMFNPPVIPQLTNSPQALEYIELHNTGPTPIDLQNIRFTTGITFSFTNTTTLNPGEYAVLVNNPSAFTQLYGTSPRILGQYAGYLDNAGESITLEDHRGETILQFDYNNSWEPITDGLGFSLVITNPSTPWNSWGQRQQWSQSSLYLGSPSSPEPPPPAFPPIRINEALVHTDPPQVDTIELYNPTPNIVNLGGWFLTDDFSEPKKYRLPQTALIPPYGFLLLTEPNFNPTPGSHSSFSFSSIGESAYLFSGDTTTNLTGYYHGFPFGASPNGVSFGYLTNSLSQEFFVAQTSPSLGLPNNPPKIGPVVISEIMYHPPDVSGQDIDTLEFIELHNITTSPVQLFDPQFPTNTWRLESAVSFTFPTNLTLEPNQHLLIVGFNPTNTTLLTPFLSAYNLPTPATILGPWTGKLDNSGETIDLTFPDSPNTNLVPHVLVDRLTYTDNTPWPPAADGLGASLQRRNPNAFAIDPANWFASSPTPLAPNATNLLPAIQWISPNSNQTIQLPNPILLHVNASDPDGSVTQVHFLANGELIAAINTPPFSLLWTNPPPGQLLLQARALDDRLGLTLSPAIQLTLLPPPPSISITYPQKDSLLAPNTPTPLTADASTPVGSIASVEFYQDNQLIGTDLTPPYSLPWTPTTISSHNLHAVATTTTGATTSSTPIPVHVVPAIQSTLQPIRAGSTWKYHDLGTDPGPSWHLPTFNDSTWPTGPAQLGYGDGDETTTLSFGTNPAAKHLAYYFRNSFHVDNPSTISSLSLEILRDDGAAAYLNGNLVFLDGLPAGPLTFQTPANHTSSTTDESTFYPVSVSPTLLLPGENLLAVEVHQVSGTSSDISFDAQLQAQTTLLSPFILTHPRNTSTPPGTTATLHAEILGTPPITYQWLLNNVPLPGATAPTITINPVNESNLGSYALTASNAAGSVTSLPAQLSLSPTDTDNDGLPDDWELNHGLNPNDPNNQNGPNGDPDHDSHSNLQEWIAGTHPSDPASCLQFIAVQLTGPTSSTSTFQAISNRTYTVEITPSLIPPTWQSLLEIPAAPTNRIITFTNQLSPSQFLRIVTKLQN